MLYLTFLRFLLGAHLVAAANVKFYDSLNFTGLFYEVTTSPSECHKLPPYGHGKTASLITNTCIILHQQTNCNGTDNKIKLTSGMHDNLKGLGFGSTFNAFELCSENEGGEKLNADLYYNSDLDGLAVKYTDICGCIDMPNYIGTRQIMSVDNHGNCLKLFENTGCKGKSIELRGGSNAQTRNLALYFGVPTRSISSCADHAACLVLRAKIFKFELTSDVTVATVLEDSQSFELAAKTSFRNNGSAVVTQEYHASKKITESIEITRSTSLTEMTRVETENGFEWSVDVGLGIGPFSASTGLKQTFREAHTLEKNSSHSESEKYFSEETREFSISQTIQIMPCTEYQISSIVKFIENYPVKYTVYAKITGEYAELRLNSGNIKERIKSMEYVGDVDEFTVIAKTNGMMTVDFGVETKIDGEGFRITDCIA